jgi:PDZ domain
MRRWRPTIPLLSAISPVIGSLVVGSLVIGLAYPGRPLAAESAEISSTPASQIDLSNSVHPSANEQTSPYQLEQGIGTPEAPGIREYMDESDQISVFGIAMRVETRKAEKEIQGLLVVDVTPGSPGAVAGLHPFRQPVRDLLGGVGMLASMAFPPAAIVVPLVESVPLREAYDLIIGVDGLRVTNFTDFYDCVREDRPGEIVYLNVLRNGHRVQLALHITSAVPPAESWVR